MIFCAFAGIPLGSIAQEAETVEEVQSVESPKKEKGKKSKRKSEKQGGFNLFRGFLSQFNLGVSTGYGATFYTHDLKGFGVYQPDGGTSVFIFDQAYVNRDTLPVIYSDWVNNPFGIGGLIIPVDTLSTPIITNGIPVFPNDINRV